MVAKRMAVWAASFLVLVSIGLYAGGKGERQESTGIKSGEMPTIGLTLPSLTDLWWNYIGEGVTERSKELGVNLMVQESKADVSKQVNTIENYIVQKVDAIILGCVEPYGVEAIVEKARNAGIHVVTCSIPVKGTESNITVTEYDMGKVCGEMAAEWIKKIHGNKPVEVGQLDYPTYPTLIERADTTAAVIMRECPNAKIVARQSAVNIADGMKQGEIMLQGHPNIKVAVAINDGGALGFARAMIAAGKVGPDIGVFGISTANEFMEEMANAESILRGTSDLHPIIIGRMAVDSCLKLLKGEKVPEVQNPPLEKIWKENIQEWFKKSEQFN